MTKTILPKIKVLFIDDDIEDMEIFKDALIEFDPTALLTWLKDARKVKEYSAETKRHLYNIIFLDINMPLLNGIECLRTIRKIKEFSAIPVVMFSTSKNDKDIDKCLSYGANLYAQKPNDYRAYNTILKKVFCPDWRTKYLNPVKETFIVEV